MIASVTITTGGPLAFAVLSLVVGLVMFSELIKPSTATEIEEAILALLQIAGFSTTSWTTGSVPKRLVKAFSSVLATLWLLIARIAQGAFLETATGGWLTLLARNWFQVERDLATATTGKIRIQNLSGALYTIASGGQLVVEVDGGGGLYFKSTSSGLPINIDHNQTKDVDFTAEAPGTKYNVAVGTITQLRTPIPGITVTNPAQGSTGTWITSVGTDDQTDESLRDECKSKWSTLGTGSPAPAYIAWAKEAAPGVTRVKVRDDNPYGAGSIGLVLANAVGGASATEVAAVDAFVQPKKPAGTGKLVTDAATAVVIAVTGTVRVDAASRDSAEAEVIANFVTLTASYDIGGGSEATVRGAEIVEQIMKASGVRNFTPTPADTALAPFEVPTFTLSLTWVSV